jgi:flagellar biosynthesis/type III secretory pathway chaperone
MQNPLIAQLDLVEQQFNRVAAFLANGDAPALQNASAELQRLVTELSRLLNASATVSARTSTATASANRSSLAAQKALRQRVQAMAQRLQFLRDNLSRQAAANQMALNVVVPAPAKSTYSGGSSVYGAVARQGAVHKFLAA